jgi:hypothetical protein
MGRNSNDRLCSPGQGNLRRCRSRSLRHVGRSQVKWGHRLHSAINGYASGIVRLIGESYGQQTVQAAWREFNISGDTQPFYGYDVNAELFYSWLFHKWTPDREEGHEVRDEAFYGVPPTRAYLDRKSSLNPLLRTYLETCLSTSARFYEVLDCVVGLGFRANDVLAGATYTVTEALASASVKKGDILYAHLIPMGEVTLMDAISPRSFPPQCKGRLLGLRKGRRFLRNEGRELREVYFTLSEMMSRWGSA